ncbi:MAG TPA: formimidoylglutamate deiminase [Pyrinomonadaceae bacterium]
MNSLAEQDKGEGCSWLPDMLYTGGRFESGLALVCDAAGRIIRLAGAGEVTGKLVRLENRALLPGLVNAHSHAFQRVIRGRTERRTGERDSFWTWRELMYSAALRLTPEDIYDASRMAFLEMALGGITAVGEFHYIHHAPDRAPYADPNLMAKAVVGAARSVGLRIALLRVAYARSGYRLDANPQQARFIEARPDAYLQSLERLRADLSGSGTGRMAWVGIAPHSVRAVPLPYLRELARYARDDDGGIPFHMHVAEQPAELAACVEEYGRTPVELLSAEGLLGPGFTGVHGIHLTKAEARQLARAGARICACPTTERNLGDGIVPADLLFAEGVAVCLGTDSHTQIDLLEDARELEYHLRLQKLERAVLSPAGASAPQLAASALAARLFDCATINGAQSIGAEGGKLEAGLPADFFTVALDDASIAGAAGEDLLSGILFSLARTAVRDVFVGGREVVRSGEHPAQPEITERFTALQQRLWS